MRSILFIGILVLPFWIFAQNNPNQAGKIKFDKDFRFNDGIFLNLEDVKRNNPISKTRIITDLKYDDYSFFENLFKKNVISILDDNGQPIDIKVSSIWGFSQNGILFVYWNEEFNRVPVFGNLCHFIADKTYIDNSRNPYYNGYGYYYSPYYYPQSQTVRTELRQYLIDMETGKIMDYNYQNLEIILSRDTKLYEEFVKLKKKKKRQLKFLYLRKYNDKHPFYFEKL